MLWIILLSRVYILFKRSLVILSSFCSFIHPLSWSPAPHLRYFVNKCKTSLKHKFHGSTDLYLQLEVTTNSRKTVTGRQLCDNSTTILDRTKYLIFYGLTSYLTKQRESWNCRLRKVKLKSRLGCLQYFTHYSAMHEKRYKIQDTRYKIQDIRYKI